MIREDFLRYAEGKGLKAIGTFLLNPCWHATVLYRISSWIYRNTRMEIISKLFWYLNRLLYCVDIDYRASISGGLKIVHGLGLVIGKEVVVKGPLTIYQGVTLGGSEGRKREDGQGGVFGQPILGSNCILYANSSVFGPVILGNSCIIRAGRILTKDLQDNERY